MSSDRHAVERAADKLRAGMDEDLLERLAAEPFDTIERNLGLRIESRPVLRTETGCGVDGSHTTGSSVIVVANSLSPGRRNFTALHEAAHALVHRDDDLVDELAMDRRGREVEEAICNAFAANVLIPPDLVDQTVPDDGPCAPHVVELFDQSQASRSACCAAAVRKLRSTGYVLVADDQGTVIFAAHTPNNYVLAPGATQPADSLIVSTAGAGHARGSTRVRYRSSNSSPPLLCDAVRDEAGYVLAVLTSGSPPWGGLGILSDDAPLPREVTVCPHCDSEFKAWKAPCDACGDYECPECGKCGCRVGAGPQPCSGCRLEFPPHLLVNGLCEDCR